MKVRKRMTRVANLLRERDFKWLLVAQFVAQAADGFAQVAVANELIFESGGDTAARLLGVSLLTLLPYSFIAPFLGVFVDRWPRRSLLAWTNAARGLLLIAYPVWSQLLDGDAPFYAAGLILLGLGRLFLTTKGATLPFVLHDHHLLRGNAMSGGGGMISALLGGVVGAGAASKLGTGPALVIAGGLYIAAAVSARALSDPMAHRRERQASLGAELTRIARELFDGISQVWERPRVRIPLGAIFLLRTAAMITAFGAILVIKGYSTGKLGPSALALGAAGVGAFVGAVITPSLAKRFDKPALVLVGFVIAGTGIVALGGIEALAAVVLLTFSGGLGGFIAKVSVDAQIQEEMPDEYRGRAFALYDILYNLASVAAGALLVPFEDHLRPMLVATGIACLVAAALVGRVMKRAGMLTGVGDPAD